MTRPEKWNWLHRDAKGRALLVGPDCPDCQRRFVARYRCTDCPATWEVPGVFVWSWQGKSHYHRPDDDKGWRHSVLEHVRGHDGEAVVVPLGDG